MKKILSFMITLKLVFCISLTSFAFADYTKSPIIFSDKQVSSDVIKVERYLYEEDFTTVPVGEKPASYSLISSGNTSVEVVNESTEKKKEKNILKVYDNDPNAHVGFEFRYPDTANTMLIEVRMKYKPIGENCCPFYIRFFGNGSQTGELTQWSSGGSVNYYTDNGDNRGFTNPEGLTPDEWYTFRYFCNFKDREVAIEVTSEALKKDSEVNGVKAVLSGVRHSKEMGLTYSKGLSLDKDYTGEPINEIKFLTTGNTGEYYFDYIKVSEVKELKYRGPIPNKITPPYTVAPVFVPADKEINICFKGVYKYFVFKPFSEDGKIFVPLRTISSWYDLNYEKIKDGVILKGERTYELYENKAVANGKNYGREYGIKSVDDVIYVSLEEFVSLMGDKLEIKDNNAFVTEGER